MNLQDIIDKRVALIKLNAKLNAEINDLACQMKQYFHEEGLDVRDMPNDTVRRAGSLCSGTEDGFHRPSEHDG